MDEVRKGEIGEDLQKVGGVGLRHSDHPAKGQVEDLIEDQGDRIRIIFKIRIRTRMIDSRGRHLSKDDNVLL